MKKMFVALLLPCLPLTARYSHAQLSPGELAVVQKCLRNIEPAHGQLSSLIAAECVKELNADNAALLKKLKVNDAEEALRIVSSNNSLVDLGNILAKNSGVDIASHLIRVLENKPCVLCSLGLGPEPESIVSWAQKEGGASLSDPVKASVRDWDSLGEIRTASLSSAEYNHTRESWAKLSIRERYILLARWSKKEAACMTDRVCRTHQSPDPRLLAVLREDLGTTGGLAELESCLSAADGEKAAPARPDAQKGSRELSAAARKINGLKDGPVSDIAAYLSRTFDQAAEKSDAGAVGAAQKNDGFVFRELSRGQAERLAGRLAFIDAGGSLRGPLADELRGTRAGDEILAFYKDPLYGKKRLNKLSLDLAENRQAFYPPSKTIFLDREMINAWLRDSRLRPEQLFEGDMSVSVPLRKLSRHLAPIFLHEATHQRQLAKAISSGTNFVARKGILVPPYQMEMETEAYAMEGSFIAEHLQKRGPEYASDLGPDVRQKAALFLEKGVDGLRLYNHRTYYYETSSFEGSAAEELAASAPLAQELRKLKTRYATSPKTMSGPDLKRMRDLRAKLDSRFNWYTAAYSDFTAAEEKIDAWRKETLGRLFPSAALAPSPPLELP